jgi:hypothetical protein
MLDRIMLRASPWSRWGLVMAWAASCVWGCGREPVRAGPVPASPASAASVEPEPTGKIWICVYVHPHYNEPLANLRVRIRRDGRVVSEGRSDEEGCVERHGYPLGDYTMDIEGYETVGPMLLDADDPKPLLRNSHPLDGGTWP